ncbi:PREDICTED: androgen-induced gene 1 protein [Bison bison bison]|uniref:Androgen-induced gene 1 protein n=1 Tax=Bison bison bison TaxID=43346 RepID=A0A6P3IFY6_BISBB|nr:PREDICTED: androgen-induced gene 1 protein [Bison bison bison]
MPGPAATQPGPRSVFTRQTPRAAVPGAPCALPEPRPPSEAAYPLPGLRGGCPRPGLQGWRRQQQNDGDDERADATPPTRPPPEPAHAAPPLVCSSPGWVSFYLIDLLPIIVSLQVIQAVFFGICVLTDLSSLLTRGSGNQEQERQLKKLISLRDWMLAVLAFPVGVFVVAVFWIIYAYDREMIYPKLLDNFIPGWLNHGMHTTVLPFILIEMRTSHHTYPSRSSGLAAICTFSVGYILWVCWVHHVTGMWVYPFLEHIGPGARILFFGSTTILMNFLYLLGEVLNSYIWDTQRSMEEEKEKPKLE